MGAWRRSEFGDCIHGLSGSVVVCPLPGNSCGLSSSFMTCQSHTVGGRGLGCQGNARRRTAAGKGRGRLMPGRHRVIARSRLIFRIVARTGGAYRDGQRNLQIENHPATVSNARQILAMLRSSYACGIPGLAGCLFEAAVSDGLVQRSMVRRQLPEDWSERYAKPSGSPCATGTSYHRTSWYILTPPLWRIIPPPLTPAYYHALRILQPRPRSLRTWSDVKNCRWAQCSPLSGHRPTNFDQSSIRTRRRSNRSVRR